MNTRMTIQEAKKIFDEKIKSGTLIAYEIRDEKKKEPLKEPNGRIVSKLFKTRSEEKGKIAWIMFDFSQRHGVQLFEDYRFDTENGRQWEFDWCIPDERFRIAVEYEGLFSEKSRHTTVTGYTGDVDKYNAAIAQGWNLIRLTAINYKTLSQALKKFDKK